MSLIQRIQSSIAERARFYSKNHKKLTLSAQLDLPPSEAYQLETLQVLASIKSYLGKPLDVLVDVGAHKGDFARPAFYVLKPSELICFEPNADIVPALAQALESIPWQLRSCALSDREGEKELFIHMDQSMSSLLEADSRILAKHFATYDTSKISSRMVKVSTLDQQLEAHILFGRRFFIKLDTQGNELDILRGASTTLKKCDGIICEFMFTTPYISQPGFESFIAYLGSAGFKCAAALEIKRKPTHHVSGVDFLFLPK
jgi:FkbM family methyltransferase